MIKHIVMWKFKEGTEAQQEEFFSGLLGLQGQIQLLKSGHQQRLAAGRGPQSPPNSSFSAAV